MWACWRMGQGAWWCGTWKTLRNWMSSLQERFAFRNPRSLRWILGIPWHLPGCIHECWGTWLMSLWGYCLSSFKDCGRWGRFLEENKYHSYQQEEQEGGPRDLQAGQFHLGPWEKWCNNYNANKFKTHKGQEVDLE